MFTDINNTDISAAAHHSGNTASSLARFESAIDDYSIGKKGWPSLVDMATAAINNLKNELLYSKKIINEQKRRIAQLEDIADSDCLTGLANRRRFERGFASEIERVNRGKSRGGLLVMIDLDNFKQINDQHGHQAGDECLKIVAQLLKSEIRALDLAARLGGDEFVLIFSDAEADKAIDRTQSIAIALNSLCLEWQGQTIDIRASVGLRSFSTGDTPEQIVRAADDTLYEDKKNKDARQGKKTHDTVTKLKQNLFKGEKISVLTLHQ